MAHAAHKDVGRVGPAIAGTAGVRPISISRKRFWIIVIIGVFSILFALVVSLHHGFEAGNLVVKPASGNSMFPWSYDGDTLVAWGNFSPTPGKKYLFHEKGVLYCKELAIFSNKLVLVSVNKAEKASFECTQTDVVGEVLWVIPTHFLWEGDGDPQKPSETLAPAEKEYRMSRRLVVMKTDKTELRQSVKIITAKSDWHLDAPDYEKAQAVLLGEKGAMWQQSLKAPLSWKLTFGSPRRVRSVRYQLQSQSTGYGWRLKINGKPVETGLAMDNWYTNTIEGGLLHSVELRFEPHGTSPEVELAGFRLLP